MRLDFLKDISKKDLESPIKRYMTPVETSFDEEQTVDELLKSLHGKQISHEVLYFYAVDKDNRLCGVVPTRDMLLNKPDVKMSSIMKKKIISIKETESLEEALKLMTKHQFMALPVVDNEGHLCGLFEIPPAGMAARAKAVKEEESFNRDMFQLIGLTIEQGKPTSSFKEYRYRMPWLLCNLMAGLLCAAIANLYHGLLAEFVVISMFIPLVLTLGESVSVQSMAMSLQYLNYGKMPWKKVLQKISVEWRTSILLGFSCALLVGAVYGAWYTGYWPMVAISASIFLSMIVVTTFGSMLPILLNLFSLDPKVASGPVVLMITDVTITAIYMSFSHWLLVNEV